MITYGVILRFIRTYIQRTASALKGHSLPLEEVSTNQAENAA